MEQESQKRKLDETGYEPSNAPLLCVNNCGFFGSASTSNLCSKCYKEYLLKQSKEMGGGDSATAAVIDKKVVGDDQNLGNIAEVKQFEELKPGQVEEGASSGNPEKRPANRCSFCRKRVGLTGFKCKCEQTFCSLHRYSDKHNCVFDYKGAGQDAIAKANPVVKAEKIEKI